MILSITLTDPVSGLSVPIKPVDGVTAMTLDVQPSVRAVTEERVGSGGQVDNTVNLSAAAVTLSLRLWKASFSGLQPEQFIDQIGQLLSPSLRPVLVVESDQWDTARQLSVRFDSKTAPVDNPETVDVSISWKAPNGYWQAPVSEVELAPFVTDDGGLSVTDDGAPAGTAGVPVTAGSVSGSEQVVAAGGLEVPWTGRLYGPCTGPKIANDTTGLAIEFLDTLVLGDGQYVGIDSLAHTATLNGNASHSLLDFLSWDTSDWWLMEPGENHLRYYPTSGDDGAVAVVQFQPGWMA